MKLSSINLNLLVALDALLEEQSVSKAAMRLNLSQAQLSNILKELRIIFEDDLLVRGPERQMVLTEKANSLILPVNDAINKFEEIFIGNRPFSPETSDIHFTIGSMSDYISTILSPDLFNIIYNKAPNISLDIVHMSDIKDYDHFKRRELNLAIGNFAIESSNVVKEELFRTRFVCALSRNHKALKNGKLEISELSNYPLILVFYNKNYWDGIMNSLDKYLGKGNYKYSTLPHSTATLRLLEDSKYICIANINSAKILSDKFNLKIMKVPFLTPRIKYYMYWKKVDTSNQAHIWLRNLVKEIFNKHIYPDNKKYATYM